MFIEKRKKGKATKFYLSHTVRQGNNTQKIRKFLGTNLTPEKLTKRKKQAKQILHKEFFSEKTGETIKNLGTSMDSPAAKKIMVKRTKVFSLNKIPETSLMYNKSFHSKVFTLYASTESELYNFGHRLTPHFKLCYCFFKDDEAQWFIDQKSLEKIRAWTIRHARTDPKIIFTIYGEWEKDWNNFTKLANSLVEKDLTELSDKELYALFKKFYIAYCRAGSVAYMCDSFMSTGEKDWLEEMIQQELKERGTAKEKVIRHARSLTSPVHLSFTLEAEYQLLKTAEKIQCAYPEKLPSITRFKKEHPELYALLKKHEKDFYWMQNNYYTVKYLDAEYMYEEICKQLQEAQKQGRSIKSMVLEKEEHLHKIKEERKSLINSKSISQELKNVLEVARLFTKWKDVRKSGVYIGVHHFDAFLEEIAKRTNYTKRQLTFSVFQEIEPILLGGKDITNELAEREKQTFFAVTDKSYFVVGGHKADNYFKILEQEQQEYFIELRGVVASPGHARGRVRIIRKAQDMHDFKTGEILVTNQTTPEFVSIMKKAAAIITEQGGITSHAAVVSREMKKPCIIGTKIATKALMNGEVVEVDARNGIIRRER